LTPSLATASSAAAKAADAASDASSRLPLDIAGFVTSERKAAVVDISQNLDQTLRFLQGERIAALRQVHDERIAAMEQIALERVAVLREVREIAETQRRAINKELEQSSMKVVDHASALVARIVAATLVAVFAVCVFLLFLARRLFLLPGTSRGIQRAA
jgi:copper oxidase (laccase) domain-containing protein